MTPTISNLVQPTLISWARKVKHLAEYVATPWDWWTSNARSTVEHADWGYLSGCNFRKGEAMVCAVRYTLAPQSPMAHPSLANAAKDGTLPLWQMPCDWRAGYYADLLDELFGGAL